MTFFFVTLAWVFFRSKDFPSALLLMGSLLGFVGGGTQVLTSLEIIKVSVVVLGLLTTHWFLHEKRLEHAMQDFPEWIVIAIWVTMLCGLILTQGGANAFIYFQF